MERLEHRFDRTAERLAASLWCVAASLYLVIERAAALAFSPAYSYAHNYISDLGVPDCGAIFDGRAICSPLHGAMNATFVVQGLFFLGAAIAIARSIAPATARAFIAFAALNCVGNILVGTFPENAFSQPGGTFDFHLIGAVLAIVFGNAAALRSASTFRGLGLPRIHRQVSIALPLLAAAAFVMLILARVSGTTIVVPNGVWERMSVYTITSWQLLSAACLLGRRRSRRAQVDRPGGYRSSAE